MKPFVDYFRRKAPWAVLALPGALQAGRRHRRQHGDALRTSSSGFSNTEIGAHQQDAGHAGHHRRRPAGRRADGEAGHAPAPVPSSARSQALTNLAFLALSLVGKNDLMLAAAITVDNLCAGLAMTAFAAFMMSLCHKSFSATQYALLSTMGTIANRLIGSVSGYLATWMGWPTLLRLHRGGGHPRAGAAGVPARARGPAPGGCPPRPGALPPAAARVLRRRGALTASGQPPPPGRYALPPATGRSASGRVRGWTGGVTSPPHGAVRAASVARSWPILSLASPLPSPPHRPRDAARAVLLGAPGRARSPSSASPSAPRATAAPPRAAASTRRTSSR